MSTEMNPIEPKNSHEDGLSVTRFFNQIPKLQITQVSHDKGSLTINNIQITKSQAIQLSDRLFDFINETERADTITTVDVARTWSLRSKL